MYPPLSDASPLLLKMSSSFLFNVRGPSSFSWKTPAWDWTDLKGARLYGTLFPSLLFFGRSVDRSSLGLSLALALLLMYGVLTPYSSWYVQSTPCVMHDLGLPKNCPDILGVFFFAFRSYVCIMHIGTNQSVCRVTQTTL